MNVSCLEKDFFWKWIIKQSEQLTNSKNEGPNPKTPFHFLERHLGHFVNLGAVDLKHPGGWSGTVTSRDCLDI